MNKGTSTDTKPHHLCGPQTIETIIRKPGKYVVAYSVMCSWLCTSLCISIGFTFLKKYYNVLYQALIPNCKLTIGILKEHLEISDDVKDYILEGSNLRIKCQRIINLLIFYLDRERDYKQFCYLFNLISVLTDLPHRLTAGMHMCMYNIRFKDFIL